jgi:excisionase family DNA binding protein
MVTQRHSEDRAQRQELVAQGLVGVAEAGKFLGLSRSMVYLLMEQGRLPFAKIGKARRIPRRALVDFAEQSLATTA